MGKDSDDGGNDGGDDDWNNFDEADDLDDDDGVEKPAISDFQVGERSGFKTPQSKHGHTTGSKTVAATDEDGLDQGNLLLSLMGKQDGPTDGASVKHMPCVNEKLLVEDSVKALDPVVPASVELKDSTFDHEWDTPSQEHQAEFDCQIVGNKWKSLFSDESQHSKWEEFRKLAKEGLSEECSVLLQKMELVDSDVEDTLQEEEISGVDEDEGMTLQETGVLATLVDEAIMKKQKRKTKWCPTERVPRPRRGQDDGLTVMEKAVERAKVRNLEKKGGRVERFEGDSLEDCWATEKMDVAVQAGNTSEGGGLYKKIGNSSLLAASDHVESGGDQCFITVGSIGCSFFGLSKCSAGSV